MEVNITLVLQILQFGCAYFFLYRFVFAPASLLLDEKEQFKHALYLDLEQQQQAKDILLQDFYERNKSYKALLVQQIPRQTTQSAYQKSTFDSTLYTLDSSEILQQDMQSTEKFLIDHLSQVEKK